MENAPALVAAPTLKEEGVTEEIILSLQEAAGAGNVVAVAQLDKMAEKERYQSLLRNMDSDEDPLTH